MYYELCILTYTVQSQNLSVCALVLGFKAWKLNKEKKLFFLLLHGASCWQHFKSRMAETAETLKPIIKSLANRFDRLEELVQSVRQQQRVSEASFDSLEARFERVIEPAEEKVTKPPPTFDRIIECLRSREARTKPRDLYEVEALADILQARTAEQVFDIVTARLTVIYTATTRGWREAQAFARKDIEEQLGLPTLVSQPTSRPPVQKARRNGPPKHKKS